MRGLGRAAVASRVRWGFGAVVLGAAVLGGQGREHALGVVRQVAGRVVERLLGEVRRRDALVPGLELERLDEGLELVADHRAVRQPQGQAAADVVVDVVDAELLAELLVVRVLEGLLTRLQGRRTDEGQDSERERLPPHGSVSVRGVGVAGGRPGGDSDLR